MGPNEPDEILRGAFGGLFEGESTLPPEEVWQNVRAAVVVTEKKRRGFFFWLIPAVIVTGAGAWLLLAGISGGDEHPRQEWRGYQEKTDVQKKVGTKEGFTPVEVNLEESYRRAMNGEPTKSKPSHSLMVLKRQASIPGITVGVAVPVDARTRVEAPINEGFRTITNKIGDEPTMLYQSTTNTYPAEDTNYPLLAARLLPVRAPEPVSERQALQSHGPEYFFPRWVIGLEAGLGTNKRTITGNFSETYNSNQLVTQAISLNNRCFALSGGYRFNRFISVHTGISTGVNTYRSDWYLRMLTQSSGSYVFQTSEGSVKMASEDVNGYFSESDTALFRMRLHYSSRYYSIPLSVKLSLPGTRLSGYVRLGGSYDIHTTGNMKASLKYGNFWSGWMNDTKTVDLESADRTKLRSAQALIGFGVETHRDAPLQFFVEPQMSIPLTPVYNNSGLKVTSQYMQVRAGMTFFLPSHPTKRSVYTSW